MKNSIAILLTDTHATPDNIDLVSSIFNQAFELAKKEKVKFVIHLGDFFTSRQGQRVSTLVNLKSIFKQASDLDLIILAIPGNHDKENLNGIESYLDVYENNCFNLFSEPDEILIGNVLCHFIPYFREDKYVEYLLERKKKINKKYQNILFTHIARNGVKNNDGTIVENNLDKNLFSSFSKIYVGHYHNENKELGYIGGAYQQNFGETIPDKGFKILYSDGSIEHISSKFPRYIKVKLDAGDKNNIKNSVELYSDKKYDGDHIRFIFTGKQEDIDSVKNKVGMFADAGIDVKFESDDVNDSILSVENDEFIEFNKGALMKELIIYSKQNGITTEQRNYGLKLLKEIL